MMAKAFRAGFHRVAQRAGDCHAIDATRRLEQLVRRSKNRIRVSALYPESRSRGRRLRSVAVRRGETWKRMDESSGVPGSTVPLKETIEAFKKISEGEYDNFPEQAFFMCGGLEDLERNAHELMKG